MTQSFIICVPKNFLSNSRKPAHIHTQMPQQQPLRFNLFSSIHSCTATSTLTLSISNQWYNVNHLWLYQNLKTWQCSSTMSLKMTNWESSDQTQWMSFKLHGKTILSINVSMIKKLHWIAWVGFCINATDGDGHLSPKCNYLIQTNNTIILGKGK